MKERELASRLLKIAKLIVSEDVPPEFKKQWKDEDRDNDGKKNEPKPDFLKDKKASNLENVRAEGVLSPREVQRAIRDAIMAEHEAVKQYELIADSTSDFMVKEVLQDIANEEKVHVGELHKLLEMLSDDEETFMEEGEEEVEEKISHG